MSKQLLPKYYRLLEPVNYDSTTIKTEYHVIDTANNDQKGLNNNQSKNFNYSGENKFLRPALFGFLVKAGFRTKAKAGGVMVNNRNADITLANGWFWHLWKQYKLPN